MSIKHYEETDPSKLGNRADRFKQHLSVDIDDLIQQDSLTLSSPRNSNGSPSLKRIKGTSRSIEKDYFRLTSAPPASSIRPLDVLKQALVNVKRKYIENEDYVYASNQLKAVRQDLTVQNINNRFTVHVYETHARIALISGDLSEYNQCQSRLQEIRNKFNLSISSDEFDCYKILHSLFRDNKLELIGTLRELSFGSNRSSSSEVRFALEVVKSIRTNNSHRFFQLYQSSPHYSGFLMDYLVNGRRKNYLGVLLKSQQFLSVDFIQSQLQFSIEKDCYNFLYENKVKVVRDGGGDGYSVDCRATLQQQQAGGSSSSSSKAPTPSIPAVQTTGLKRVLHSSSGRGDIVSDELGGATKKHKTKHKLSLAKDRKHKKGSGGIDDIYQRLNGSL